MTGVLPETGEGCHLVQAISLSPDVGGEGRGEGPALHDYPLPIVMVGEGLGVGRYRWITCSGSTSLRLPER
jgi:hypothetical protein